MNAKKTTVTSVALPRIVAEALRMSAKDQNKPISHLLQDWIAEATGIPFQPQPYIADKIRQILKMDSVYPETHGTYPSRRFLYKAFETQRVYYQEDGTILIYSKHKTSCYCFIPRAQEKPHEKR